MHRQVGDAQRGRIFETVDAQGRGEHESQEKDWETRRLGGGPQEHVLKKARIIAFINFLSSLLVL